MIVGVRHQPPENARFVDTSSIGPDQSRSQAGRRLSTTKQSQDGYGRLGMRTVSRWLVLKRVLLVLAIYSAAAVTYVLVEVAAKQLWG